MALGCIAAQVHFCNVNLEERCFLVFKFKILIQMYVPSSFQILSIVYFSTTLPYESTAIHCYAVLFFILVVCSEMDWTRLFKDLQVLHNWVARGVWYGL